VRKERTEKTKEKRKNRKEKRENKIGKTGKEKRFQEVNLRVSTPISLSLSPKYDIFGGQCMPQRCRRGILDASFHIKMHLDALHGQIQLCHTRTCPFTDSNPFILA